jgi:hypothetical protein
MKISGFGGEQNMAVICERAGGGVEGGVAKDGVG